MTDQTLTTGRSLSEFTAQLASAQPAPGGGGAAAPPRPTRSARAAAPEGGGRG